MANSIIQRSFAAGEISPALYARADVVKYATGLRTLRNKYVLRHGGTANRGGSKFCQEIKDSEKRVRLVEFVFSREQRYCIELGDQYVRFLTSEGAYIYEDPVAITGITQASPGVFTSAAHGLTTGDEVFVQAVVGMTQVNSKSYRVASTPTVNTFTLEYLNGDPVNTGAFTAYSSGGTFARVYEIDSPFVESDLQDIHYTQSADVISLAHKYYAPQRLARIDEADWTMTDEAFAPSIIPPTGVAVSGVAGTVAQYVVTSVKQETIEESIASAIVGNTNTPTTGSPNTITWTAVTGAKEYNVYRETNGVYGLIGVAGSNSFVDKGFDIDATDTPPAARTPFAPSGAKTITGATQANPGVLTITAHGFKTGYLIYIESVGGMVELNDEHYFVEVLSANTISLKDRYGNDIDTSAFTAYTTGGTAKIAHNYPSSVMYYQQRKCYMQTINEPEKFWASRTGLFSNFTTSSPIQDDDAVTFSLAGRKVNKIKSGIDVGTLILLTEDGEWNVKGNDAGTLVPQAINPVQVSYIGASNRMPLVLNKSVIFSQAQGAVLHDLFADSVEGQKGSEISIFSAHLVDGFQINDMAYQKTPHSLVWAVRDDGILLCLTYVREQQVAGWSRHDFEGGLAENVAAIPGDGEDQVFVVVKRTIDGRTTRYIERMASRNITDIRDAVMMDSALTFDGRNQSAITMTLSGGTNWTTSETLTLTASATFFTASDIGNHVFLYDIDGNLLRFNILGFTSGTVVTGKPFATVPTSLRNTSTAEWSRAVDQISGLDHLEGEDLAIIGDGTVVGSPNNEQYDTYTVANGSVTLNRPYAVIHAGLPYTWDLETLDIDVANGETFADKKKFVSRVSVFLQKSRGGFFGVSEPKGTDPLENLVEMKIRNDEGYEDPVALQTGIVSINMEANWNNNGRVFIRGVDPSPVSILAIVPEGLYPQRSN